MTNSYNHLTQIFGIIGFPLGHTLSPLIHNSLMNEYNCNGIYLAFELEKPDKEILNNMIKLGFKGLSVTIPHKEWAYKIADEHDFISDTMKSSNTLILEKDVIKAYNTDGPGALDAIKEYTGDLLFNRSSGNVLILGSGGSAKGISFSLMENSSPDKIIFISARNDKTGIDLVKKINRYKKNKAEFIPLDKIEKETKHISLIIQTTPVGMKKKIPAKTADELLLKPSFFSKEQFLFDIVYNPLQTPLVKAALKNGAKTIPGYEMLLNQAYRQFNLFTGLNISAKYKSILKLKLVRHLINEIQ